LAADNGNFFIASKAMAKEWMEAHKYGATLAESLYPFGNTPFDTQSDRYIYSFNGKSGVFEYNTETGELLPVPYAPIEITTNNGFQIKDSDGHIYFFGIGDEVLRSDGTRTSEAYYITKIKSQLSGDSVVFSYKSGTEYHQWVNSNLCGKGLEYKRPDYGYYPLTPQSGKEEIHTTEYDLQYIPYLLDSIKWKGNYINFSYTSDRQDKYKDRLTRMTVYAQTGKVRDITFDNNHYWGNKARNYRMRLEGIAMRDAVDEATKQYRLNYNMTPLPDYNYYSLNVDSPSGTDYWGYYNGSSTHLPVNIFPYAYFPVRGINRDPNEDLMKACCLQSIYYPTGGHTTFEFEANRATGAYDYRRELSIVGGLRIHKIISFTDSGEAKIESFEYEGTINQMITRDMFQYTQQHLYAETPSDGASAQLTDSYWGLASIEIPIWNMISSEPLYSLTGFGSSAVFYHTITKYIGTPTQNSGKQILRYADDMDYAKLFSSNDAYSNGFIDDATTLCGLRSFDYDMPWLFHPYNNYEAGLSTPLLYAEEDYEYANGTYILRKKVHNEYQGIDKGVFVSGVHISTRTDMQNNHARTDGQGFFPYLSMDEYNQRELAIYDQKAIRYFYLLKQSRSTEYLADDSVSTTVNYSYDPEYRTLSPIQTVTDKSDGTSLTETFLHPYDFAEPVYVEMASKYVMEPIVKRIKNDNESVIALENSYKLHNGLFVTDQIKSSKNSIAQTNITYHTYDSYGNPIYITKDDGIRLMYLWSYNGQYPIAEIQMGGYSDTQVENIVKGLFSVSSLNELSRMDVPAKALLRDGALQKALPNAQVTTCTYKPLVGVTSITDSDCTTTYYEYDGPGRLKWSYINDEDGNRLYLKREMYHYKNQ
jgi:hypothetical protein